MGRKLVTQELVDEAAEMLLSEGKVPTLIDIQARIGGSYTSVKKHLDIWVKQRSESSELVSPIRRRDAMENTYSKSRSNFDGRGGLQQPRDSRILLPYSFIEGYRKILAQGETFRDWAWAQQAIGRGKNCGDWFVVEASAVDREDPDCVWRRRHSTGYERQSLGYPLDVFELWSPVRAVALYELLELPLRASEICLLDSGESDAWRYQSGEWRRNSSPLAKGSESVPHQCGVFRRVSNNSEPWLYVNSIDIAEGINDQHKGYVIPWAHKRAFYWLEKLRNWQEKYNPISVPTSWRDLEAPRLGRQLLGSRVDLDGRRESCFLFRNAAGSDSCRDKPITSGAIDQLWHLLMAKSETCFAVGGDGRGSRYPLGGLRASLVSALFFAGSKNTYPNTCSAPRRFQSQQSRS